MRGAIMAPDVFIPIFQYTKTYGSPYEIQHQQKRTAKRHIHRVERCFHSLDAPPCFQASSSKPSATRSSFKRRTSSCPSNIPRRRLSRRAASRSCGKAFLRHREEPSRRIGSRRGSRRAGVHNLRRVILLAEGSELRGFPGFPSVDVHQRIEIPSLSFRVWSNACLAWFRRTPAAPSSPGSW